ncbi:unnamed protein product, partial [marine sediment metagenome]
PLSEPLLYDVTEGHLMGLHGLQVYNLFMDSKTQLKPVNQLIVAIFRAGYQISYAGSSADPAA